MSDYVYNARSVTRAQMRPLELFVWLGLGLMVAFLLTTTFNPAAKAWLARDIRLFPLILVGMYLLFLIPSRRLYRWQKYSHIDMSTTRKGFTYHDPQGEKIYSWRDISKAEIRLDADPVQGTYVRRIVLFGPKGRVVLDNDPPRNVLHGVNDLVGEIDARVRDVRYKFHWFHPMCPFCLSALPPTAKSCASCKRTVTYGSKLFRPWELLREEGVFLFLILILAGPLFLPLLLAFIMWAMLIPLLRNRASTLKPYAFEEHSPQPPEKKTKVSAVLLAVILTGMSAGALAAPAAPTPVSSSEAPEAAYLPLAVGNTWEYRSNYSKVVQKVTGLETVNGVDCFVLESFVGDSPNSTQKEYCAYTKRGVEVLKRVHKGSDFFLDTPEVMLMYPLNPGLHWTWQGSPQHGSVYLAFWVKPEAQVEALDTTVTVVPVYIQARAADGSEIQTKRWYARNVGMVREVTSMKKAGKNLRVEAMLVHYSLRQEYPTPRR